MDTEVLRMIAAVKEGDNGKAIRYATLYAENLDKQGRHTDSTRVRRALGEDTLQSPSLTLDTTPLITPLPEDKQQELYDTFSEAMGNAVRETLREVEEDRESEERVARIRRERRKPNPFRPFRDPRYPNGW